jgi:hypothetical protein
VCDRERKLMVGREKDGQIRHANLPLFDHEYAVP